MGFSILPEDTLTWVRVRDENKNWSPIADLCLRSLGDFILKFEDLDFKTEEVEHKRRRRTFHVIWGHLDLKQLWTCHDLYNM